MSLRVMLCALGHEYRNEASDAIPGRDGLEETLRRMPVELLFHDIGGELIRGGYWTANAKLWDLARSWKPDVMLCEMSEEQMDRRVVERITNDLPILTVGWFANDRRRFDRYSRHWARAFDWVVTSDKQAVCKYRSLGQPNVIVSPPANSSGMSAIERSLVEIFSRLGCGHLISAEKGLQREPPNPGTTPSASPSPPQAVTAGRPPEARREESQGEVTQDGRA